jgi:hypothetical protein
LTFWASKRNVVVSKPIFSFRRKEAISLVTTPFTAATTLRRRLGQLIWKRLETNNDFDAEVDFF